MIDRYLGEFAIALGLIFLCVGFFRMGKTRRREVVESSFPQNRAREPSIAFLGLGMLLIGIGAVLVMLL